MTLLNEWIRMKIKDGDINYFEYSEFSNVEKAGKGASETVNRADWESGGIQIALKILANYSSINEDNSNTFLKELDHLRQISFHPNINRFIGVTKEPSSNNYIMVSQYANQGNLREYLKNNFDSLQWNNKIKMALDIACGLKCLHSRKIIHRDLHAKNILVHDDKPMIADLGLPKQLTVNVTSNLKVCGMPAYVEPQCYKDDSYVRDEKSDIYSLGVLLWEISSGRPPFSKKPVHTLAYEIANGLREQPIINTPSDYVNLYQRCWDDDPNLRPNIDDVFDTLKKCSFQSNTNNKISSVAVDLDRLIIKDKKASKRSSISDGDNGSSSPRYSRSQVEIKLSCTNLPDLDFFSKSDPQIILFTRDIRTQKWKPTKQRTEVVMNDLNPKFVKSFIVDYVFEELQQFRFICVDVDENDNSDLRAQEFIGQFDCDLGSLVGRCHGKMDGKLYDPKHPEKNRGRIIISAEEINQSKRDIKLQFQAHNIPKRGLFKDKPELFLIISRENTDHTFSPVYQTSRVSSSDPNWEEIIIKESTLCNGDMDRALSLQVKQYKKNGSHKILGECTANLRKILDVKEFPLHPPENNSILSIGHASVEESTTFLEYIAGGTEINLVVAIDFTEPNGDPQIPKSLHYIGGQRDNDYQRAINSVGRILEGYDYDRMIPVYGFGAKFNGVLSHAHPLNNNFNNPEVEGVEEILAAYSETMKSIQLCGPAVFSPIIDQTADKIREEIAAGNNNVYYILLIITAGLITDMDSTIKSIVSASVLPLSIVIVGVGNADFTNMNILDADTTPLMHRQVGGPEVKMDRDIVQFVAMKDFQTETAQYHLPKAVLEEIPEQFMGYMKKHNIPPRSSSRRGR